MYMWIYIYVGSTIHIHTHIYMYIERTSRLNMYRITLCIYMYTNLGWCIQEFSLMPELKTEVIPHLLKTWFPGHTASDPSQYG